MKSIKLALLCGAALAVTTAGAKADELSDLKAQVESLNARVAAMETAPSVPAGYQLLAVSAGQMDNVPGLELSGHDRAVAGNKATVISVMPTADAPAGTTISWSGYVKAGLVYNDITGKVKSQHYYQDGGWVRDSSEDHSYSLDNNGDWDVLARGQLRVVAKTDTAVGEVGVELKMRADYDGNGASDVYMKTAWGYWAMTPELAFGGGYSGSLGDNGYDIDSNCTCGYIDNASSDAFDPGDTTQMRLTYASGPFSIAAAVEDGTYTDGYTGDKVNGDQLGAAGKIKYSGDAISGEISGVYRGVNSHDYDNVDAIWQANVGLGFGLGSMANLYLAASMGEGPMTKYDASTDDILGTRDINTKWWGASAFGVAHLTDVVQAELGVGYRHAKGDNTDYGDSYYGGEWSGVEFDQWSVLGGVYYNPVDQLTLGVEAEWINTKGKATDTYGYYYEDFAGQRDKYDANSDNVTVDLVSIWRF